MPDGLPARAEHPLEPALRLALDSYGHLRRNVHDYTCLFVRRERTDDGLGSHEYIWAKVRHRRMDSSGEISPLGIYLRFLKPSRVQGREVLFVDGKYENQLIVRKGGPRLAYVVTEIRPDGELAMRGNRYPLTEFGLENLLRRLIEVAREDIASDAPCEVKFYPAARVDDRLCTGLTVRHTEKRDGMRFYLARVFLDRELNVPVHYESYDWPAEPGDDPPLLEQYSYQRLELNVGLSDADFDRDNPDYRLRRP